MDKLTLGQSLRIIAERTAFRTEDEQRAVLACIDEHIDADEREQADAAKLAEQYRAEQDDNAKDPDPEPEPEPEPVKPTTPAKSTSTAVKGRGRG